MAAICLAMGKCAISPPSPFSRAVGLAEESTGERHFSEKAFRCRQMSRGDESGRQPTGALQRALRNPQVNLDASLQSPKRALSRADWTNRGHKTSAERARC